MNARINFTVKLADLFVSVNCRYPEVRDMCRKYIVPDCPADVCAYAEDEEIAQELELADIVSEWYAEFLCIYRAIARELPRFSRAVFHGASITYKGKGLLFTAPSGTGKSTHISLWRKYLGEDVKIVNGDKPIIRTEGGKVTVYGTPWAGKERWQRNVSAELTAICLLEQGKSNEIRRLSTDECIKAFMNQIYLPDVPNALQITLGVLGSLIESVPVYKLSCDMSEQAVKASFESMLGEEYKK